MKVLFAFAAVEALKLEKANSTVESLGCALNPGAGMDEVRPFVRVYKDGFYHVGCLSDEMEQQADKHGRNAMKYSTGAQVSIVRYEEVVDRDRRVPMTPSVCFEFCRTVPDMLFFGLIHGRSCYCEPYFARQPGNGICDRPCEGDSSVFCGGKFMSDVYEMHGCADAALKLQEEVGDANDAYDRIHPVSTRGNSAAAALEASADELLRLAGRGGDMDANKQGQAAKVQAGTLLHAAEKALSADMRVKGKTVASRPMMMQDMTRSSNLQRAERLQKELKDGVAQMEAFMANLKPLIEEVKPEVKAKQARSAAKTTEPVLTAVKRWEAKTEETNHTTCGGEQAGPVAMGLSKEECAEVCDRERDACMAYNHFTLGEEESMCVFLSSVERVWGYTCDSTVNECTVLSSEVLQKPLKPEVTYLPRCFGTEMAGTELES